MPPSSSAALAPPRSETRSDGALLHSERLEVLLGNVLDRRAGWTDLEAGLMATPSGGRRLGGDELSSLGSKAAMVDC